MFSLTYELTLYPSRVKQQFVVIPPPLNSSNRGSYISRQVNIAFPVKMFYKKCFSLYFRKNRTCLSVCLFRVCQSFSVSCTTVCFRNLRQTDVPGAIYISDFTRLKLFESMHPLFTYRQTQYKYHRR